MKCRPYGRFLVGAAPPTVAFGRFLVEAALGLLRGRHALGRPSAREAARRRCVRAGASWFRRGRRPGRSPGGFRRSQRDGGFVTSGV